VNALIAVVFAFFTLTYAPATEFITSIMPLAIIFFVVFFFLGFVVKAVSKGLSDEKGNKDFTLLIIILGLALLLFATQGPGVIGRFLPGFEEQASNIMVISAVVFIFVILLSAYKLSKQG
jgi:Na+/H+ antiporter NhaC